MLKSIQHFEEVSTQILEKVIENFMKNPKDMASFVTGIQTEVVALGLNIIQETLESCDQMLRESDKRRLGWVIVKKDPKELITSLGKVWFEKTLFQNKVTQEREYLLDRILGITPNERLTEDAVARLLQEAVQTSYRRGGEETSLTDNVSKQTVKNKLHSLVFPPQKKPAQKKEVDYLYIDADEDHVALQFREEKGDLAAAEGKRKNNCVLAKLVYVYEGIEKEAPKSKRRRLVNPHYFSGVYDGEANGKLWDEVYEYMDSHYELSKVKKIYLNGDGGGWIKAGQIKLGDVKYVLDEFHMKKYLVKMTAHMLDNAEEIRKTLMEEIKTGTKSEFRRLALEIREYAQTERKREEVVKSADFLLDNWTAAKTRLISRGTIKGCSAEGHVSHVLSGRMSSRPMGWSRLGANQMAHLRAYYWNGGDMLELVRAQNTTELEGVTAEEEKILSSSDMLKSERNKHGSVGKYVESISHRVSVETKKYAWFRNQIWGL